MKESLGDEKAGGGGLWGDMGDLRGSVVFGFEDFGCCVD